METLYCIAALLSPAAMAAVGLLWRISPPAYQGKGLAYRTPLSSASREAWDFAHRHCARLWLRLGIVLLLISGGLLAYFSHNRRSYVLWLIGGQMALFCSSAFFVDILLKNSFDEKGTPIS